MIDLGRDRHLQVKSRYIDSISIHFLEVTFAVYEPVPPNRTMKQTQREFAHFLAFTTMKRGKKDHDKPKRY